MFRKDFYIEVPELSKMSDAEVEEYRTEMEGIKVGVLFKHICSIVTNFYFYTPLSYHSASSPSASSPPHSAPWLAPPSLAARGWIAVFGPELAGEASEASSSNEIVGSIPLHYLFTKKI